MWCSHVMFTCDCCIFIFDLVIFEQKPACDVHMWFLNVFWCDVHMWCSHVFSSTVLLNFSMWCSHVIFTCDFPYVMFTCDFKNNHIRFPDEMSNRTVTHSHIGACPSDLNHTTCFNTRTLWLLFEELPRLVHSSHCCLTPQFWTIVRVTVLFWWYLCM